MVRRCACGLDIIRRLNFVTYPHFELISLVLVLVNDCRSDVSPVKISDSDSELSHFPVMNTPCPSKVLSYFICSVHCHHKLKIYY